MRIDQSSARRAKAKADAALAAGEPAPASPSTIIDISPPVSPQLGVWPGDTPYKSGKLARIREGANLDLGHMHTTYHVGAHTDAPQHYHPEGADASALPLDAYFGACQVVEVAAERGERFGWEELRQAPKAPRILLKTGTFPDPNAWNDDFAAPEPELVDRLGSMGVRLLGFDTPSTDLFASKDLPAHRMLHKHGMMNLEGLVLGHVAPGRYTLAAFPLRLVDADASPVRAVLMPA